MAKRSLTVRGLGKAQTRKPAREFEEISERPTHNDRAAPDPREGKHTNSVAQFIPPQTSTSWNDQRRNAPSQPKGRAPPVLVARAKSIHLYSVFIFFSFFALVV